LTALDDTLALRYAPGPGTWWEGISHLPPGHLITVTPDGGACEPVPWWSPPRSGSGAETPSLQVASERLEEALQRSVSRRAQHGDAPVGLYLSGGLDSCLVGAMLSDDTGDIPAFSHGYDGKTDEHSQAQLAATRLGLPWRPVHLTPDDLDALPEVIRAVEQPVANSDILGLWVLAREASKEVKAVLCGEGADELFGSYPHQQLLHRLWSGPTGVRRAVGAALPLLPSALLQGRAAYPGAASDGEVRRRWASALGAESLAASIRSVATLFTSEDREKLYTDSLRDALPQEPCGVSSMVAELDGVSGDGVLDALIDQGLSGWLDGYHLGRENRIAMAHGIEARYPYLDTGVVDAVLPLDLTAK
ncbi:MAG: asparagine synthase-related protein, partial [Myxococcota bacterium]|nr:asparagine synthase-related protein [Myxococcota bacterium]